MWWFKCRFLLRPATSTAADFSDDAAVCIALRLLITSFSDLHEPELHSELRISMSIKSTTLRPHHRKPPPPGFVAVLDWAWKDLRISQELSAANWWEHPYFQLSANKFCFTIVSLSFLFLPFLSLLSIFFPSNKHHSLRRKIGQGKAVGWSRHVIASSSGLHSASGPRVQGARGQHTWYISTQCHDWMPGPKNQSGPSGIFPSAPD